jgi:hypothetical protein
MALTIAGHPTVVLVHDVFEDVARKFARVAGVDELKICAFPQPRHGHGVNQHAEAGIALQKIEQLFNT